MRSKPEVGFLASARCGLPTGGRKQTGAAAVLGCPATALPIESRNTPGWEWVNRIDLAGPGMVFPGAASAVAQEWAWDPSLVTQNASPRFC